MPLSPSKIITHHSHLAVCVSDTGYGIAGKDLPHIFNRFYQRDRTQEGKIGHSGLGLAITTRILELHGRTIIVESETGAGATFTFFLPAYHPA